MSMRQRSSLSSRSARRRAARCTSMAAAERTTRDEVSRRDRCLSRASFSSATASDWRPARAHICATANMRDTTSCSSTPLACMSELQVGSCVRARKTSRCASRAEIVAVTKLDVWLNLRGTRRSDARDQKGEATRQVLSKTASQQISVLQARARRLQACCKHEPAARKPAASNARATHHKRSFDTASARATSRRHSAADGALAKRKSSSARSSSWRWERCSFESTSSMDRFVRLTERRTSATSTDPSTRVESTSMPVSGANCAQKDSVCVCVCV